MRNMGFRKQNAQMVASMANLGIFNVKFANDLRHHGFHLTIDVRNVIEKPIKGGWVIVLGGGGRQPRPLSMCLS